MSSIILLGLTVTFLFRIFYYAIGEPSSDNRNPNAILSGYVFMLCLNRLRIEGVNDYNSPMKEWASKKGEAYKLEYFDLWNLLLNRSLRLFRIENVLGICPVCTFFWLSLFAIFIPTLTISNHNYLLSACVWASCNILNKIIIKWT